MAPRRARATVTELNRAVRVAKQQGAAGVEVRPDGGILIHIAANPGQDLRNGAAAAPVENEWGAP